VLGAGGAVRGHLLVGYSVRSSQLVSLSDITVPGRSNPAIEDHANPAVGLTAWPRIPVPPLH